jgi:hypothetical protein
MPCPSPSPSTWCNPAPVHPCRRRPLSRRSAKDSMHTSLRMTDLPPRLCPMPKSPAPHAPTNPPSHHVQSRGTTCHASLSCPSLTTYLVHVCRWSCVQVGIPAIDHLNVCPQGHDPCRQRLTQEARLKSVDDLRHGANLLSLFQSSATTLPPRVPSNSFPATSSDTVLSGSRYQNGSMQALGRQFTPTTLAALVQRHQRH